MKLPIPLLALALCAVSSGLYAQAKPEEAKAPPARAFDCSRAKDPKGCEERMARMREARDKARTACAGKAGEQRRECMEKSFCSDARDPAKCEANLKERAERRREQRAAKKKAG
jgi:hypothetical protein